MPCSDKHQGIQDSKNKTIIKARMLFFVRINMLRESFMLNAVISSALASHQVTNGLRVPWAGM